MTGRVPWSEYNGEDIERAVAMFIAMEHPTAVRITPSRGDGGVDILDRGQRTVVYQVKGFHAALTSGQQRQVEKSVDRLVSDPRWADLTVDEWHLVTPWNPTSERLEWIREYVRSKGLPDAVWDGKDRCDAWAAKYPYIVDYFFHGSRQTVQTAASQLLEGFRLTELSKAVPGDLSVDEVRQGLSSAVTFLNERDIFYDYGLAVGPATSGIGGFLPQETGRPNLVTSIHQADKNIAVRIDVFAKTAMSIQERPINMVVRMKAEPDSAEAKSIKDFMTFGGPLTLPMGSVDADFDGPDVLAQPVRAGALFLSPVSQAEDPHPELRLVVFDDQGEQVTSLLLEREYHTHGLVKDGVARGLETALVDPSGCLRLLIRVDSAMERTSMRFDITRPDGVLAMDAYPALWTYRSLQWTGHTFVIAPRFGPIKGNRLSAPPSDEMSDAVRLWFDVAKSLTLMQEHTPARLYFPDDLSQVSPEWIRNVCFHGALLNGQVLQKPAKEVFTLHTPNRPEPDEDGVVSTAVPWKVTIDEAEVDLGFLVHEFSGTFKETTEHGEHGLVDVWHVTGPGLRVRRPAPEEIVSGV